MSTVAPHGQCLAKVSLGQPLPTTVHRKHTFGKKRIPLRKRVALHYVLRVQSQAGFGRGTVKINEEESEVETESEPSSGTKKFMNLPGTIKLPGAVKLQSKGQSQAKSNKVIFVAGATGKVGSRTVRELLKLGFSVRAGTRNVEKAQALFEDVAQSGSVTAGSDDATPFGFFSPAKLFGFLKPKLEKGLEIVECNLEDAESIEPALGNAGVVVCCIGASEKEVLDVTGPYRIDFKATANLIDAASSAQVNHFVLLTSLGTQKFGFPAAVLNLFWGVLVWKAKAEKALLESGIPYTIVRPGGMERPTDAYKETHTLRLAEADKLFGGQVSNLQVAELLASIVENPDVSVNKIIEAVAETTAPLRPIRELLEEIPAKDDTVSSPGPRKNTDVTPQKASKKQEEENFAKEKRALALKEEEEKRIQAEKLADEKLAEAQKEKEERIRAENDEKEMLRLQTLRKKYEEEIEAAREKEEAANSAAAAALAEKAELEKRVAEVRAKAEAAALAASQAKAVEAAVVAAARKGNVLSDEEKEKIMESVKLARLPKEDGPKESKPSSKKKPAFSFFGKAAAPSTETATDVELKEEPAKVDVESKVKAKAEKEAAAKLSEQKKQEEKAKKVEEAKKLAEQEAAKALEAKQKEEQDKLEKEAKERAEKEAAEAKRKEEAEAKRKEEEAEARKKEEEAEAKRKEAAEAKMKEEELSEAKKKEEQKKAEKEAERLKIEAEEKAKALAEEEKEKALAEQVAAAAAAEAEKKEVQEEEEPKEGPAPGRGKGFRWFWQPAEPDTSEEVEITKADVAEVPVQAKVIEQLPPSSTPLSPYTRYPGLKPPCPPIASPPTAKAEKAETSKIEPVSPEINRVEQTIEEVGLLAKKDEEVVVEEPIPESQADIEARARQVQETAAREREALEKAEAAISLKWFWQKPDPVEEDSASKEKESVFSSKEEAASPVKEQVVAASKNDALPQSSRPLSPYAQFPNLKPPAPPRASLLEPSSTAKDPKPVETLAKSSTPLSPYAGFPELKPPTAPTPLRNKAENGAVPESAVEKEEEKIAEPAFTSGFKWPWQQ